MQTLLESQEVKLPPFCRAAWNADAV